MAPVRLHVDHPAEGARVDRPFPVRFWLASALPLGPVLLEADGVPVPLVPESRLDVVRAFPDHPFVAGYRGLVDSPSRTAGKACELVLRLGGTPVLVRPVVWASPGPAPPPVGLFVAAAPWCGAEAVAARLAGSPGIFLGRPPVPGVGPGDGVREAERLAGYAGQPFRIELLVDGSDPADEARSARDRSPGARVLLVLREPVARAAAAWADRLAAAPPPPPLAVALTLEAARERRAETGPSAAVPAPYLLCPGRYVPRLLAWRAAFPGRVAVVVREDPGPGLEAELARVLAGAGGPGGDSGPPLAFPADPPVGAGAGLDAGVRESLATYFGPDRAALEAALGRPLPWGP